MIDRVVAKSGIAIRLTDEQWAHITEEHCELAGLRSTVLETVSHPDRVLLGGDGELLAVRKVEVEKSILWWSIENKPTTASSSQRFSPAAFGRWRRGGRYGHSGYSGVLEAYSGGESSAAACRLADLRCRSRHAIRQLQEA